MRQLSRFVSGQPLLFRSLLFVTSSMFASASLKLLSNLSYNTYWRIFQNFGRRDMLDCRNSLLCRRRFSAMYPNLPESLTP